VSIEESFAYRTFRPGQRELAVRINQACAAGEVLLVEAMSGFGKTAAVLAGAVLAAEQAGHRVVYACRTKRQILRVLEEVGRLQQKHPIQAASLLSKFDYCLLKRTSPNSVPQPTFGWYCWFNVHNNLCSYFLNVGLLGEEFGRMVGRVTDEIPTHQELLEMSLQIHVCPYEVERLAVTQARLVVVPYHYVFDPASTSVLFSRNQIDRKKIILIVDEAHNLRDFMREVNSDKLTLQQLEDAVQEARGLQMEKTAISVDELRRRLGKIHEETPGWLLDRTRILDEFRRSMGEAWLQNLAYELLACSEAAWGAVAYERRLPLILPKVGQFLVRLSSSPRAVLVKWEQNLALIDPNPVNEFASLLDDFGCSILISATVSPSAVFARSLGLSFARVATYHAVSEPSMNVRTVIDRGVTTRYKFRGPEMYSRIADKIAAVVDGSVGVGVGIFATSYTMLEAVHSYAVRNISRETVLVESRGMSNEEAARMFDCFRSCRGSILFAVQGGRFSEGEDFREGIMGTVIVVGLSIPPPSPMLFAEYDSLKQIAEPESFLMLSRLPAIRKAIQSAGRHIRDPGRRGLVFLMDQRFDAEVVRDLMPTWLKRDMRRGEFTAEELKLIAHEFWDSS
jgi:DNA excision repair protein ERCC-2